MKNAHKIVCNPKMTRNHQEMK